jgi:hypothetical protein
VTVDTCNTCTSSNNQHLALSEAKPKGPYKAPVGAGTGGISKCRVLSHLAFAAIKSKHTGAWLLWTLARYLDKQGSGRVEKNHLYDFLKSIGLKDRRRRRWIYDALHLGIVRYSVRKNGEYYYMASLDKATLLLGGARVGYAASVRPEDLVRPNWRAAVFVAFLATRSTSTRTEPMSQIKRAEVTGISPRVQRNWLHGRRYNTKDGEKRTPKMAGVTIRKNYAKTYWRPSQVAGVRDIYGYNVFVGKAGVRQRLPDSIVIDEQTSSTYPRRRSKKAQALVNFSLSLARDPGQCLKLFTHSNDEALVSLEKADKLDEPRDIFQFLRACDLHNQWLTLRTGQAHGTF